MANWLVKTEPSTYAISDLAKEKETPWDGVRNYQARNFLKEMKVGDGVLIYHSSTERVGVVGVGRVSKKAVADETQFDRKSEYFDQTATRESPRWFSPHIKHIETFSKLVSLEVLRETPELTELLLLRKGNRLSVMPIADDDFELILNLGR